MITTHVMPTGEIRQIKGKVDYYLSWIENDEGKFMPDNLTDLYSDNLISIDIQRQGESKFFGYGVSQKLTFKRRNRMFGSDITVFKVSFGDGTNEGWATAFPPFHYDTATYDETANETTLTAYDGLYYASKHTVSEIDIDVNVWETNIILPRCAKFLKCNKAIRYVGFTDLELEYLNMSVFNGNFDGTETIRVLLDALAEYWQAIYYIDADNNLVLQRLDKDGDSVYNIDKSQYFTLTDKGDVTLKSVCAVTELGDNVIATLDTIEEGETQYLRDNPYLELYEFKESIINNAITNVGGMTISQLNCKWRGNYLLEVGDKISFDTELNGQKHLYLVNDAITYNGGFSQVTQWEFASADSTPANPANLGDALRQTYARVDKVNKQIELVASETSANGEQISTLQLNTDAIYAAVSSTSAQLDTMNEEVAQLSSAVSTAITSENLTIEVEKQLTNGTNKVVTTTGFTFDDNGLSVTKSNSEMSTTITDNGMTVYKNGTAVLSANNVGVDAVNLHATTYLIVGNTSRFEDYGNRTGCFWIGG